MYETDTSSDNSTDSNPRPLNIDIENKIPIDVLVEYVLKNHAYGSCIFKHYALIYRQKGSCFFSDDLRDKPPEGW
jgi:hypothetical protein